MKKLIPVGIALVVGLILLMLLKPEAQDTVIVAARSLPAGHTLTADDLTTREMPGSMVPSGTAMNDATGLVGQTLRVDLAAGDLINRSDLGDPIMLEPDERGITILVDDASGLGGFLKAGDLIGITAVIFGRDAAYSKVTVEGLRVIWLSPEFRQGFSDDMTSSSAGVEMSTSQQRAATGVVMVAVPITRMTVLYDFTNINPEATTPTTKEISVIELISALNSAGNARVQLYLMPKDAQGSVQSSGMYIEDLVLVPTVTPTPMPTATLRPGETRAPEVPASEQPSPTPGS